MTNLPDDTALTQQGLAVKHGDGARILLIACGAIAREVLAVIEANNWDHIDLQCLPAILHNSPDAIPAAVERKLLENKERYSTTYLLYADCGTGGHLFDLCKNHRIEMLSGPHCYSFFEGNQTFAAHADDEFTAFYLTDFLVRQFDAFVIKPLGLDRHPELRDSYFGHYEKLVYQAQTNDPALDAKAQECAQRLGLEYERRQTGYGDLEREMKEWLG
ncbi:MAG: DUF1638 domain-containing protein [Paracoccaceae bacterium]|nr:DUF1638 domain-containing protein [Paracoccaceae bacterium]